MSFQHSKIQEKDGLWRSFIMLCLFFFSSQYVQAQETLANRFYILNLLGEEDEKEVIDVFLEQKVYFDSLSLATALTKTKEKLQAEGYWLVSFDNWKHIGDTVHLRLYLGQMFEGVKANLLSLKTYNFPFLSKKEFKRSLWKPSELAVLQNRILTYAENTGYPFAKVEWQSVQEEKNQITMQLSFFKNQLIAFDTLRFNVDSLNIKKSFLVKKLGIRQNDFFSQQKFKQSVETLDAMPFLKVDSTHITFKNEKAYPKYWLKRQNANEIDAVLGVFPSQREGERLRLAGNVNIKLFNLFASGKRLWFNWQRFQQQGQTLFLQYRHPYLLGTPIDGELEVQLLQQDSSFTQVRRVVALGYDARQSGYFQFFTEWLTNQTGNNESVRENNLVEEQSLQFASGNFTSYGVQYELNKQGNSVFLQPGIRLQTRFQVGNKNITSDSLAQINESRAVQYMAKIFWEGNVKLGRYFLSSFRNQSALLASKTIFRNEFFRIGGLQTLRGFNENAIFSSAHILNSAEVHAQFNGISFFSFFDYARWSEGENSLKNEGIGVGLGLNLNVNNGLFNLVYAVGKTGTNAFRFNEAKIHFGYANRF